MLPVKRKYYSADKKYCVEVIPKKLESQLAFFEDKSAGRNDAGAAKGVRNNRAKAIVYFRGSIGYSKTSEFPLLNEVSPVDALISGDGRYVVTFDNWHMMGYGDNVVVIYRSDGTLIRKFSLEDLFTDADIQSFKHSVSSIWWGDNHYIDDKKQILHLKAGDQERTREVTIDLKTGNPLEPKRDLFPQTQVIPKIELELADVPDNPSPGEPVCTASDTRFDLTDATRIPSPQLRSKFKRLTLPGYPPIAVAGRAKGKVVVEVLVSKTGELICARTLTGLPLFTGGTLRAVKLWEFEPIETSEGSSKVVSTFAITFKLR
jgi:TonB family protein